MRSHRASQVVSIVLSNNVCVQYRRVALRDAPEKGLGRREGDEKAGAPGAELAGQAAVTIAINGAELLETAENRGVSMLASALLDSESSILAEGAGGERGDGAAVAAARPAVKVAGAVLQDTFLVRVQGTPEEIGSSLAWLAGAMRDCRVDPEKLERRKRRVAMMLASPRGDNHAAISGAIVRTLHAEADPRLLAPSVEQVMRLTAEDVRGWMLGHTERAPIEVAVVGDVSLADAVRVVASTLGTLPMREPPSAEWNRNRRTLVPAVMPARADIADPAISRGGIALAGFVGCELSQTRDHRALRTIAEILSQRAAARAAENAVGGQAHAKARGGGSAARAVRFSANPALAYPSLGAVMSAMETDGSAEGGAGALRAMDEAIDDLRENPPTLEELAGATSTLSAQAEAFEDDARAWSTLLARCLSRGVEPDDLTGGAAFYRGLTSEAVMQTLRKYSAPERRFTILLHGPAAELNAPKDARAEDGAAPPNGGEGKGQPRDQ